MKKKNLAFTLAEVLIVIGIIGVVAALTLPNLNHATGDKETVTKVKKIYSTLTEAFDRAQAIYGDFDTWFNDLKDSDGIIDDSAAASERFAKRVTEFMKVSKDCGFDAGCFSSSPMSFFTAGDYNWSSCDNLQELLESRNAYSVSLSDGTSLAFFDISESFKTIRVDIDGPNKGKNMWGNDIFDFVVGYDCSGTVICKTNQLSAGLQYPIYNYTAAWVIENGNLDYLKCYDELNWETKTSCE